MSLQQIAQAIATNLRVKYIVIENFTESQQVLRKLHQWFEVTLDSD